MYFAILFDEFLKILGNRSATTILSALVISSLFLVLPWRRVLDGFSPLVARFCSAKHLRIKDYVCLPLFDIIFFDDNDNNKYLLTYITSTYLDQYKL